MKILLDECLDRRLARHLRGHQVFTVTGMGWSGKKNGELLNLADDAFDIFVTVDQNLPNQQNLAGRKMAVVLLRSTSNRLADLLPLISHLEKKLTDIRPGTINKVPA